MIESPVKQCAITIPHREHIWGNEVYVDHAILPGVRSLSIKRPTCPGVRALVIVQAVEG